jgi:hypothetical protein
MINSPTPLAALAPPSPAPSAAGNTWPRLPRRGLKRPRGLWKARRRLDAAPSPSPGLSGQQQHHLLQTPTSTSTASPSDREEEDDREMMMTESGGEGFSEDQEEEDNCGEEEEDMSQDSGSSKRQRRESRSGSCSSAEFLWAAVYVDPTNLSLSRRPSANADLSAAAVADTDAGAAAVAVANPGAVYDNNNISRPALATGASANADAVAVAGTSGVSPAMIGDGGGAACNRCRRRRKRRAAPAPTFISNMVTTSIAESCGRGGRGGNASSKETFEYSDWERIKETLARASELCDRACCRFSLLPFAPLNSTFFSHHTTCVMFCTRTSVHPFPLHYETNRRRHDECNTPPPGGDPRIPSFSRPIPRPIRFFLPTRRR